MGVHRFYETLKKTGKGGDEKELTRYYYDDISDEVMTRTFKVNSDSGQKPAFVGEHRASVDEAPDDVRRRVENLKADRSWTGALFDTIEERVVDTLNDAVSMFEGMIHTMRDSVNRASLASRKHKPVWLIVGVVLVGYAMARHRDKPGLGIEEKPAKLSRPRPSFHTHAERHTVEA